MFQHTNFTNQLLTEELTIREYTYRIIAAMLRKYNDDIPKIAKILDISPATIYRILKEFQHQL
jgi:transcriptional regulator with PAS, ATPase and Fis domain